MSYLGGLSLSDGLLLTSRSSSELSGSIYPIFDISRTYWFAVSFLNFVGMNFHDILCCGGCTNLYALDGLVSIICLVIVNASIIHDSK